MLSDQNYFCHFVQQCCPILPTLDCSTNDIHSNCFNTLPNLFTRAQLKMYLPIFGLFCQSCSFQLLQYQICSLQDSYLWKFVPFLIEHQSCAVHQLIPASTLILMGCTFSLLLSTIVQSTSTLMVSASDQGPCGMMTCSHMCCSCQHTFAALCSCRPCGACWVDMPRNQWL